jgi:hypothetical protein
MPEAVKSFRPSGQTFSGILYTIFNINTIISEPCCLASARFIEKTGIRPLRTGPEMRNSGTKSKLNTLQAIAEGLFSAYVAGRKGDRYGHYDLRLGRHATRAHRPRPQAFRPAGSRTSSVGSVDDQAIAAGRRHFSSEVGEQN